MACTGDSPPENETHKGANPGPPSPNDLVVERDDPVFRCEAKDARWPPRRCPRLLGAPPKPGHVPDLLLGLALLDLLLGAFAPLGLELLHNLHVPASAASPTHPGARISQKKLLLEATAENHITYLFRPRHPPPKKRYVM